MEVVPVIDLKGGLVVRAVGGQRHLYRPLVTAVCSGGSPSAVAQWLVETFGFTTVYTADLDAIEGGPRNWAAWQAIGAAGLHLWLDAGAGTRRAAEDLVQACRAAGLGVTPVIGLETLARPEELAAIVATFGPQQVIFSLDLRGGQPLTQIAAWRSCPPEAIAAAAVSAGIQRLIVLDLADVGKDAGVSTLPLCRRLVERFPHLQVVAGGGVRGLDDLQALASAGCTAALVGTALHSGVLPPDQIRPCAAARPPASPPS